MYNFMSHQLHTVSAVENEVMQANNYVNERRFFSSTAEHNSSSAFNSTAAASGGVDSSLGRRLHLSWGLHQYPNYSLRFDESEVAVLEHMLEAELRELRRQKRLVAQAAHVQQLFAKHIKSGAGSCNCITGSSEESLLSSATPCRDVFRAPVLEACGLSTSCTLGDLAELPSVRASVLARLLPDDDDDIGEGGGGKQQAVEIERGQGDPHARANTAASRRRRRGVGVQEPSPGIFTIPLLTENACCAVIDRCKAFSAFCSKLLETRELGEECDECLRVLLERPTALESAGLGPLERACAQLVSQVLAPALFPERFYRKADSLDWSHAFLASYRPISGSSSSRSSPRGCGSAPQGLGQGIGAAAAAAMRVDDRGGGGGADAAIAPLAMPEPAPSLHQMRSGLMLHTDDSELTLNIGLVAGQTYQGGELIVSGHHRGGRGSSTGGASPSSATAAGGDGGRRSKGGAAGSSMQDLVLKPDEAGTAILHAGRRFHEVLPVTGGAERHHLVIWMRSTSLRHRVCPCCWMHSRDTAINTSSGLGSSSSGLGSSSVSGERSCICDPQWG